MIQGATRKKTKIKYDGVVRKWHRDGERNLQATTNTFLNFLGEEFDRELKHSYIKGYTAALAPYIDNVDPVLRRNMRGIFNT